VERAAPVGDEGGDRSSIREVERCDPDPFVTRAWTMSSATRFPASTFRTASVTSAFARASARAVSIPMPEAAPVTIARRAVRSTPATTSAAVDCAPNGVVMRMLLVSMIESPSFSNIGPARH
jgi:hypothetical protein